MPMFFFISKLLCDTPESPPLKIVESLSFGMPTPLSLTEKQAFVPSRERQTRICVTFPPWMAAFSSRFIMT